VTGAGRGIGKAIALRLAGEGAAVACCDLIQANVEAAAAGAAVVDEAIAVHPNAPGIRSTAGGCAGQRSLRWAPRQSPNNPGQVLFFIQNIFLIFSQRTTLIIGKALW
jgi:NAD(P)-dependent dehydrogenase (short-subunit alcohol dehydrogenase family)